MRALGALAEESSSVFGDNQHAVVKSATVSNHDLKKWKYAGVSCLVREAVAASIIQFYRASGKDDSASVLTKILPSSMWWPLLKTLLHWLSDKTLSMNKNNTSIQQKEEIQ